MRKIIFIDVDGTLVLDDQSIPESAKQAIEQAKSNGHTIFICTGRSKAELYDNILSVGFDGIIGAGGAFIEIDGEVLINKHVEEEILIKTIKYLDDRNINYYIESNDGLFASKNCKQQVIDIMADMVLDADNHPFVSALIENENLIRGDIGKICFLDNSKINFDEIYKDLSEYYVVHRSTVPIFGNNSGELAIKGVSKSNAIHLLLEHINVNKEDTVAIGDGDNDIDMFRYCNISVAMGNATDNLKTEADFVTTDIKDNGLYNAFKQLKLL